MPLVLTQNEATQSGHEYADELGVEYEYPRMYRNLIREGEPFVYYRGRQRAGGGVRPQAYLGTGVVGAIRPSDTLGRLVCAVRDVEMFTTPVPFKIDGTHLEPLGSIPASNAGRYFQRGVRRIDDVTFGRILTVAAVTDPTAGRRRREVTMPYAPPETARLVDEIATEVALHQVSKTYPDAEVTSMPHNNPGYDIRVRKDGVVVRYVEVKGTFRARPHFFMSEGERLFSHEFKDRYTLMIVYDIDPQNRLGTVVTRDGAVEGQDLTLNPTQWEGSL